jgi:hypothetical protein
VPELGYGASEIVGANLSDAVQNIFSRLNRLQDANVSIRGYKISVELH